MSATAATTIITTMTELAPNYLKIATNEIIDRLKIELALGNFLDDLADIESAYGKNLTKAGTHGFTFGRRDCLSQCTNIWESVHKISTVHNGKNHIAVSAAICQDIFKPFSEHSKLTKKKLQNILSKITAMLDDFKKGKFVHQKNMEKYSRMILDLETMLKSKEKDELESNADSNAQYVTDNSSGLNSANTKGMNRSLTKMLAKMTHGDKTLSDKCREQIKELDATESQLAASSRRLTYSRSEIICEISRSYTELEELETSRITVMRDGLSKFFQANSDFLVDKKQNLLSPIKEQLSTLDINKELTKFLQVDQLDLAPVSTITSLLSSLRSVGGSGTAEGTMKGLELVNARIERLFECMEYLKLFISRMLQVVKEIAEVEETYFNSATKTIATHGGSGKKKLLSNDVQLASGDEKEVSVTAGSSQTAFDLLNRLESPSTKSGWLAFFRVVTEINEGHSRTVDYYLDEICNRLDVVFRQVDVWKKDLDTKHADKSKVLEAAHAEHSQTTTKLQKLQNLLKERRNTLRIAKESLSNGDEVNINDVNDSIADGDFLDDNTAHSISSSSTAVGDVDLKKKKTMMQGLENLGSSFANVKFKVVVGLETPVDRISRIEKQLSALEEEERSLLEVVRLSAESVEKLVDSTRKGFEDDFESTRLLTISALQMLKSTLDSLVEWQLTSIDNSKRSYDSIRKSTENIDINGDLLSFVRFIQVTGDFIRDDGMEAIFHSASSSGSNPNPSYGSNGSNLSISSSSGISSGTSGSTNNAAFFSKIGQSMLIEIPPVETFEPIKNAVVEEERKNALLLNPGGTASVMGRLSEESVSEAEQIDGPADATEGNTSFVEGDNVSGPPRKPNKPKSSATVLGTQTKPQLQSGFSSIQSLMSPSPTPTKTILTDSNTLSNYYASLGVTQLKDESELGKFGLSSNDKVLESFSCALYPNKGLLTHGRLFVTQRYLAFSGWPDTRVLLALRNIDKLEKSNTLVYIPNAITITSSDKEEYFFGSFIERDQCYQLLNSMREIERTLLALHGDEAILDSDRGLDFGYQGRLPKPKESLIANTSTKMKTPAVQNRSRSTTKESGQVENANDADGSNDFVPILPSPSSKNGVADSSAGGRDLSSPAISSPLSIAVAVQEVSSDPTNPNLNEATRTIDTNRRLLKRQKAAKILPDFGTDEMESVEEKGTENTQQTVAPIPSPIIPAVPNSSASAAIVSAKPTRRPSSNSEDICSADNGDSVDLGKIFVTSGISLLGEHGFNFRAMDIYKSCWLHAKGYSEFLAFGGDLSIQSEEWRPLPARDLPAEDVSKLSFSHYRRFSYSHPRTTMLMFGPKNAPATQVQYLYLPCKENIAGAAKGVDDLRRFKPSRGLVLTITQFDGIPMADVFKVMQYWTFESLTNSSCTVRVGVAMHYIKSTMFKSQILNGTKEELGDQVKSWFTFSETSLLNQKKKDDALPVKPHKPLAEAIEAPSNASAMSEVAKTTAIAPDLSSIDRFVASAETSPAIHQQNTEEQLTDVTKERIQRAEAHQEIAPPLTTIDEAKKDKSWSFSAKLNVLFVVIFIVMVTVQWMHNNAVTKQIKDLKSDLQQQQKLLLETVNQSREIIQHLLQRKSGNLS